MEEWVPKRKVSVGLVATALTALSFWGIEQAWGIRPPAGAEAGVAALLGFVVSWIVPDKYEAE